jgi:hypothetical protein
MRTLTILAVALAGLVTTGQGALAQGFGAQPPAELPPASYAGEQYIDSRGCVYLRAGISGTVNWVPRLTREREPLCGFQPTFAAGGGVTAPAPAPQVAAVEPPPRPAEGAPIATVAGLPAPAATPQVIAAPAPEVAAPAPRTITLAMACEGRSGIQPNMISSRTGQPIDCGPGPAAAAPVAVAAAPAARCGSAADAYFTGGVGVPYACAPRAPMGPAVAGAPRGMNGGTDYGLAPTVVTTRAAQAPASEGLFARAPIPASNPVNAPEVVAPPPGFRDVWTDGRLNPDRGLPPGTVVISAAQAQAAPVLAPAPRAMARAPVPQAVAPAAPQEQAQTVAAPAPNGHRFVQAGTFGDPANAAAVVGRLQGLGLPVALARATRNGQALQIVLAGPFDEAGALRSALSAVRGAGFGDAFTRQ